jgi:cell division protein FtsB
MKKPFGRRLTPESSGSTRRRELDRVDFERNEENPNEVDRTDPGAPAAADFDSLVSERVSSLETAGWVAPNDDAWTPAPDEFDPIEEPIDDEDVVLAPPRRRFAQNQSWRPSSATLRQSLPLRLAFGGAVIFVSALLLTAGAKSYRDLQIVRQREAEIAVRIAASEERLEAQRHRLKLLREDPATLERLAREELGLVGKDDLVFVLPPVP